MRRPIRPQKFVAQPFSVIDLVHFVPTTLEEANQIQQWCHGASSFSGKNPHGWSLNVKDSGYRTWQTAHWGDWIWLHETLHEPYFTVMSDHYVARTYVPFPLNQHETEEGYEVLSVVMPTNDADASTIRDYLITLLTTVWREGENFDSKKPFGNSNWESELYAALVRADLLTGTFDADGALDECDYEAGDELIRKAICVLGGRQ